MEKLLQYSMIVFGMEHVVHLIHILLKEEVLAPQLLFFSLGLFLARWIINWTLLNVINGTTFSMFRANYSVTDFLSCSSMLQLVNGSFGGLT